MPTSARPEFFPHPRQGTRALPYKVLRYRARADRVVRPYKPFRRGDPCGRPPTYPLFPFNSPLPAKNSGAHAPLLYTISSPPHSTPFSSKYARV